MICIAEDKKGFAFLCFALRSRCPNQVPVLFFICTVLFHQPPFWSLYHESH